MYIYISGIYTYIDIYVCVYIYMSLNYISLSIYIYMCYSQNYGPLWVLGYITAPSVKGHQDGNLILGTSHVYVYIYIYIRIYSVYSLLTLNPMIPTCICVYTPKPYAFIPYQPPGTTPSNWQILRSPLN